MTKRTHLGTENQAAAVATAATRVAVRSATSRSVPNLCVFLSFLLFTTYSSSSSTSCSFVLASSTKADRKIFVRNNTGRRIALHWVHPTTNERSLMSQPYIANTAEFELGSYVSHQFEVEELPSDKTQRCRGEDSSCRTAQFAVSDNERQSEWNEAENERERERWELCVLGCGRVTSFVVLCCVCVSRITRVVRHSCPSQHPS